MVFSFNAMSQTAGETILLSQNYAGGTARSVSMGGAFGALGGDISSLSINPAGIAVYHNGGAELVFTPAFNYARSEILDAAKFRNNHTKLLMNNAGYVYTWNRHNPKGIQNVNFGIAYNRLSDFNSNSYIGVSGATSSMLDGFVWWANGGESGIPEVENQLYPFYEGLAYDVYAIEYDEGTKSYYSDYEQAGYDMPYRRNMRTRGGIGEYDVSFGINLNHNLYFGATLGLQDIYYEEYYLHREETQSTSLDYFVFTENYIISGSGINFKAGVIYRPIQILRVGFSIHTPTHMRLKPNLFTTMDANFNKSPAPDGESTVFDSEVESDFRKFKINTPWRYNASAAIVLKSFGLVSFDAEYVDYSKNRFQSSADFDYEYENEIIGSDYRSIWNLRGGLEFRLGPVSLRGGIGYYGNPLEKFDGVSDDYFKATMNYAGGIGFRRRNFFIDAAFSYMDFSKKTVKLYETYDGLGLINVVTDSKLAYHKMLLTFGFKFY
jgi:hypothetical protein